MVKLRLMAVWFGQVLLGLLVMSVLVVVVFPRSSLLREALRDNSQIDLLLAMMELVVTGTAIVALVLWRRVHPIVLGTTAISLILSYGTLLLSDTELLWMSWARQLTRSLGPIPFIVSGFLIGGIAYRAAWSTHQGATRDPHEIGPVTRG